MRVGRAAVRDGTDAHTARIANDHLRCIARGRVAPIIGPRTILPRIALAMTALRTTGLCSTRRTTLAVGAAAAAGALLAAAVARDRRVWLALAALQTVAYVEGFQPTVRISQVM